MIIPYFYLPDGLAALFYNNIIITHQLRGYTDTLLQLPVSAHGYTDRVVKIGIESEPQLSTRGMATCASSRKLPGRTEESF